MIKALSLKPIDFISKFEDKDEAKPTVWKVRGLTRLEWLEVENSIESSSVTMDGENIKQISNQTNNGTVHKLFMDYGLIGWENFLDHNSKSLEFSSANKDCIPKEIRDELASRISSLTSLDEAQRKNLERPLQSSSG